MKRGVKSKGLQVGLKNNFNYKSVLEIICVFTCHSECNEESLRLFTSFRMTPLSGHRIKCFVKMNKGKKCFCTDEPKMKKSLKSFMMCLDFVDFEMLY